MVSSISSSTNLNDDGSYGWEKTYEQERTLVRVHIFGIFLWRKRRDSNPLPTV